MPTRSRASLEDIADYLRAQEQVQAEQEYKKNRPWERGGNIMVGDMFGSLQDDPLLRAARERNYDATQASAEYDARTAPGQYYERPDGMTVETSAPGLRAWETPQSVRREIFGGAPAAPAALPKPIKAGSTVLVQDPVSGEMVVKYQPPDTSAAKERQAIAVAERRKVGRELELNQTALLKLKPTDDNGKPANVEARRLLMRNLVGLEEQWRALGNPGTTPAAVVSDSENPMQSWPRGFIGEPGASDSWQDFPTAATGTKNKFKSPFDIGVESVSGGAADAPRATSRRPAATKAGLANQLAAEHPDWSREKIISEVNRSFR